MIWKLLGTVFEKFAPTVGEYFNRKQELKYQEKELEHQRKLERLRGKIAWEEALTKRASESEGRDHEWELESIRNSGWKDEWVLILLSIPLVLVFFPYPWGAPAILEGFNVLDTTPDWYRWLVIIIFGAIYGIRIWRRSIVPVNKYKDNDD